jgi:hypothetical protein
VYKQIHIVGCSPRSGTTLLYEMMSACCAFDKLYGHETRFNRTSAHPDQTLLTKRPKDTQFMPSVLQHVPDFWVIYCLRDPRDVVVSKHKIAGDSYYSNLRLWREQHAYAESMQNHPRFIQVKYEDLVSDPDRVQASLVAAIPWLDCAHPFSEYHLHAKLSKQSERAMHGLRSINTESIGRWRANLPRIAAQIERHGDISQTLIECGYERDTAWTQELEGIVPDRRPSRYPDTLSLWNRMRRNANIFMKVTAYRIQRAMRATVK